MFKMHQLTEKNNKGNATVEMCFIMPIILWICVNVIYIFMDVIGDGVTQGECYLAIYTYIDKQKQTDEKYHLPARLKEHHIVCQSKQFLIENKGYSYGGSTNIYKTDYDLCTRRLRRWQLYGDVLQE